MLPYRNFYVKEAQFPIQPIPTELLSAQIVNGRRKLLIKLHEPIHAPLVLTNFETAELIKYASNAFLALKISYANAIAKLSELIGADALQVLEGVGRTKESATCFFLPAPVMCSCFPKDVRRLSQSQKTMTIPSRFLRK